MSAVVAGYAMAVPVAVFLLSVWLVQVVPNPSSSATVGFPAAAVLILLTPFTGVPIHLIAVVLVALVVVTVVRPQQSVVRR